MSREIRPVWMPGKEAKEAKVAKARKPRAKKADTTAEPKNTQIPPD